MSSRHQLVKDNMGKRSY
uniref:Uncharacterized protein n=1 Tax=Anguilla anguilla TaxID=7936 RepID=A0A0E9U1A7_ANGAN